MKGRAKRAKLNAPPAIAHGVGAVRSVTKL